MPNHFFRSVYLIAAILWVVGIPVASAQNELFVTNTSAVSVMVYTRTANGNLAPLRTISGPATGLLGPLGLTVDRVNNELFVANRASITVYTLMANGNVAPLRTISGAATGLNGPSGLTVDTVNNELMVANNNGNSVTVYARIANGNAAPLRTISGGATGVNAPNGVAVDTVNNELVVANSNTPSLAVYARTANGNVAPLRIISGAATGLDTPIGVVVDTVHSELVVGNGLNVPSVLTYSRTANGNVAPLRNLSGAATGLTDPFGVFVDTVNNELVVTDFNISSVMAYTRTANGNVAPLRILSGATTGLSNPAFPVVTASGVPPVGQYFTLTPCRVADTRNPAGPYGGPALAANADRTFVIATQCGIPLGASAVAFNFTVTQPTALGDLRVFPAGVGLPLVSVMNWRPGQTRANNAVISLGPSGDITVHVDQASGTVQFLIDVNGYFQ